MERSDSAMRTIIEASEDDEQSFNPIKGSHLGLPGAHFSHASPRNKDADLSFLIAEGMEKQRSQTEKQDASSESFVEAQRFMQRYKLGDNLGITFSPHGMLGTNKEGTYHFVIFGQRYSTLSETLKTEARGALESSIKYLLKE